MDTRGLHQNEWRQAGGWVNLLSMREIGCLTLEPNQNFLAHLSFYPFRIQPFTLPRSSNVEALIGIIEVDGLLATPTSKRKENSGTSKLI